MRIGYDRHSTSTKTQSESGVEAFSSELAVSAARQKAGLRRVAPAADKSGIGGFDAAALLHDVDGSAGQSGLSARRIADALVVLGALDKARRPGLANVVRILAETKRLIDYVADRRSAPRPRPQKKAGAGQSRQGAP